MNQSYTTGHPMTDTWERERLFQTGGGGGGGEEGEGHANWYRKGDTGRIRAHQKCGKNSRSAPQLKIVYLRERAHAVYSRCKDVDVKEGNIKALTVADKEFFSEKCRLRQFYKEMTLVTPASPLTHKRGWKLSKTDQSLAIDNVWLLKHGCTMHILSLRVTWLIHFFVRFLVFGTGIGFGLWCRLVSGFRSGLIGIRHP